jgi:hypothetical protein
MDPLPRPAQLDGPLHEGILIDLAGPVALHLLRCGLSISMR